HSTTAPVRSPHTETMRLIVFTMTNSKPEFGDVDEKKFEAQKSVPESGSLKVNHLEPDDSGIYFCAVSEHNVQKYFVHTSSTQILSKLKNIPAKRGHYNTMVSNQRDTPSDLKKKENELIKCTNNVQNYDIKENKFNDKIELDGDGRNNVRILHSAQNHLCLVNKNSVPVKIISNCKCTPTFHLD
uniref:Immunoglobulin V-set domain-containing protein n=1 Tax=Cyprinus carpio carpio TaxID=630221 RepID=A0A8C0YK46_CYPCA